MDGTIYIGNNEIEGSFDAIRALKAAGKQICFFTNNSSRSAADYVEKLGNMGYTTTLDEIYTSGQVTAEYINLNFNGRSVYVLGNDKLKAEFIKKGIRLDEDNPDVAVLGFDTTLTYDKLYKFCCLLCEGKTYIATHPDMVCPAEPWQMPDVGALILTIEATTGRRPDLIMGKPELAAGEGIKRRFSLPASKIAMVGDRLYTDIKFGVNNGFTSVLVLSGETTYDMVRAYDAARPDFIFDRVSDLADQITGKRKARRKNI